ncbi:MAG: S41 family peptidase [Eubacteriales bacterium]
MFNEPVHNCSSDTETVIRTIEACHPVFLLCKEIPGYQKAKTEYKGFTSDKISFTEFRLATLKYFKVLGDSHTTIGGVHKNGIYIDINWFARQGKLFLLDKNQKPTDIEIITIGGIPKSKILAHVDLHYPWENKAARQYNYAVFCHNKEMLLSAGCEFSSSGIEISTSDGKTAIYKFAKAVSDDTYTVTNKMIGDVFYIDLKAFCMDKTVYKVGDEIKSAVQNGVNKFIIDVRDNNGGNSNVGHYLLYMMGMNIPRFGVYIRNSDLSRLQKNSKSKDEFTVIDPDITTAVPNENINLLVLVNTKSFSAAKMLGVWVQDGNLGKIVGQISRNKPNSYGDPIVLKLPFSNFGFSVSHKQFRRPDTRNNPDCLVPDIEVPFGEDILSPALQYLASV